MSESETKPSPRIRARLKNRGQQPVVMYDTQGRAFRALPGETMVLELPSIQAERIRQQSLRGGSLVVLNVSEIGQPLPDPIERVRLDDPDKDNTVSKPAPKQKHATHSTSTGKPAKPPKEGSVIRPEIKNAAQLIAAMSDGDPLAYNHFKSVAFRVLPPGTLPANARKADIWDALAADVKRRG